MSTPKLLTTISKLTKGQKLSLLLAPVITLILSMKLALLGLSILIFIDLMTGIAKSLFEKGVSVNLLKVSFYKSIKSYLLRKTWKKAYEYGIGIVVVIIFESLVFGGGTSIQLLDKPFSLSELAVIIPSFIEVWSIFENIEAVSKNNFLKRLFKLLPDNVQDLFRKKQVQ